MTLSEKLEIHGRVKITLKNAAGETIAVHEHDNLITTAGKAAIARALYDSAFDPHVAYIELGTNATPPAAGDTALGTAAYRKATSSGNSSGAVVALTGYFTLTETSGSFKEAGLFIGGTGTLGTGTLLSHVAIDVTKTTSESMSVEWSITIS